MSSKDFPSKDFPSQAEIGRFARKDPVAAVEYFLEVSKFFFENILGWDPKTKKSVEGGGLLGELSAYTAGIEAQGNSTLHFHALCWVKGFPRTQNEEEKEYDKDGTLPEQIAHYLDAVNTTQYPIYTLFEEAIPSPQNGSTGPREHNYGPESATSEFNSMEDLDPASNAPNEFNSWEDVDSAPYEPQLSKASDSNEFYSLEDLEPASLTHNRSLDVDMDTSEYYSWEDEEPASLAHSNSLNVVMDSTSCTPVPHDGLVHVDSTSSSTACNMDVINDGPTEVADVAAQVVDSTDTGVNDPHIAPIDPPNDSSTTKEEDTLYGIMCPVCSGILSVMKPSLLFRTSKACCPPYIAKCKACSTTFTHVSLRRACTDILCKLSDYNDEELRRDVRNNLSSAKALLIPDISPDNRLRIKTAVKSYIISKRKAALETPDEAFTFGNNLDSTQKEMIKRNLQYSGAVRSAFEHKYEHHHSCFKKGIHHGCKYSYCRYSYPRDHQERTSVGWANKKKVNFLP
jgi:hypothetical protein